MKLDSEIWGPHFWFVLHTISFAYPNFPSNSIKKKYYEFVKNLPQFIPDEKIGNQFNEFLDKYPVTPYLDNKNSFIRWVHFIHNRMNTKLGKEQMSMELALEKYRNFYKPKKVLLHETIITRKHIIHFVFIFILLFIIYQLYK